MFIDTHAHLQWKHFKDLKEVIAKAKRARVNCVVNIGYNLNASKEAVELAQKHKSLYATVGIHPHNANQFSHKVLNELRFLLKKPKVVAIGEIGLDYYRNLSSKQSQKEAFKKQLSLAHELGVPVVIHDREAHEETISMLFKFLEKGNCIMHCYSGNLKMAQQKINEWKFILKSELKATEDFELANLIILADLITNSALQREESRGAHYRDDFPQRDDINWKKHIVY